MNKLIMIISFLGLLLLQSCVEKVGYYDPGQETIIEQFTEKDWERTYESSTMDGVECIIHEIWRFGKNGNSVYKTLTTYENGETKENVSYDRWAFTTPNFRFLHFGNTTYWEIEKLTDTELHVCQTFEDPLTVPGQDKTYYKFTCKDNKEPAK